MTVGRLAKELGVGQLEMFKVMQERGINAKRMGARLSSSQEKTLRGHFAALRKDREKTYRRAKVSTPMSAPHPRPVREFPRTCPCCDRPWIHRGEDDTATTLCQACTGHHSIAGEDSERRIARAESHSELYKADRDRAYETAHRNHTLRRAAFDSRAKWQAALAEVVLDHDEGADGLCWCGQPYPCRTWRKLSESNRGIHRQVEKWSSWSEARLESFLYDDARAERLTIDEDEPED